MTGYTFRRCGFQDLFHSMGEEWGVLPERHWREVGMMQDRMPLDIDVARYRALEAAGVLKTVVVCQEDRPVGYAQYFVSPHLHYQSSVWAISDTFYIAPEHRSVFTAIGLFSFVEKCAKEDGASFLHTTTEASMPGAGKVLERLGHVLAEIAYVKAL